MTGTRATVSHPDLQCRPDFTRVLDALSGQSSDFPYDVLVIDSGSMDGTAERLTEARRQIPGRDDRQDENSSTAGRVISGSPMSEGDYVAIITQDACPKDAHWLSALIGGFARGPRVAGVIGRHEAYPEHDPFTRRDMQEMFDGLALLPDVIDRDGGLPSYFTPAVRAGG